MEVQSEIKSGREIVPLLVGRVAPMCLLYHDKGCFVLVEAYTICLKSWAKISLGENGFSIKTFHSGSLFNWLHIAKQLAHFVTPSV